jgi:phosphatidylglycerol---prolipoprotein diacylglyceryl transferase
MGVVPPAVIAYPAIDPVLVRFGPFAIRWYGLAYVIGFIGAGILLYVLSKRWKLGLSGDDVVLVLLYAIIGVIVGSRLGYVLVYGAGQYWANPAKIFAIWDGGMSFHGGLVGILLAGWFAARSLKMPYLTLCDMGAVGAPVGFLFGRLGNFINGELWGRTTTVAWGMVFPGAGSLPRHPSQLYEAFLEGAVLLTIMILLSLKLPPRPRGELLGWLVTLYGVFRIGVEFFREPDVQIGFLVRITGAVGGMTMGQLLSVPMVILGVWLVVRARKLGEPELGPGSL